MNREKLIEEIRNLRSIFVLANGIIPHYITMNHQTKDKVIQGSILSEIYDMKILIDDKLAEDEIRILKEK